MLSNAEIKRLFNLYAELLLLHNKNEKLPHLLSGAAYRLGRMPGNVLELDTAGLKKNFHQAIVKIIVNLKKNDSINELDELIQLTPQGLFEMMRIKGLGGKKLAVLWKKAKIDSTDSLLQACRNNMLIKLPGFAAKTQLNIIEQIDDYRSNESRFHYATVADQANEIVLMLQKVFKTELVNLCGEIRRKSTTVACIEIIAAIDIKKLYGKQLRKYFIIQSSENGISKGHTLDEIPLFIYHTVSSAYYNTLFTRTGNKAHVGKLTNKIKTKKQFHSEEAIYKKAGFPFIEPEMREDVAEWEFIKNKNSLLEASDIKGVVHNHTTWSDGVDTLESFARACRSKGFEYCVISDHSKNAHYAGGLKEDKLARQIKDIETLNKNLKPFRIFKSIECDILVSGELDFSPAILKKLDLVIVSIHQLLKMDKEKATSRIIKAIENPFTTILGHMTGRQLLIRPGYPLHVKKVIDACAANNVVIEINANPYRLDIDWSHIPYALKKGVFLSVNPDAHSIAEIENIRWGVDAARKAGLTKKMTWNAKSLSSIEAWLKKNKKT